VGVTSRLKRETHSKILVGTHHKVLTVFLGRVFRVFGAVSGRSVVRGRGRDLDYHRDILLDHHSEFDFAELPDELCGLHVTRDPRDLLVSAMFYHQRAVETWLHVPREDLDGVSYQAYVRALPNDEARLLFELDHSAGDNIAAMLGWIPQDGLVELRYDALIGPNGSNTFAEAISGWPLSAGERTILIRLFQYFSLGAPGARGIQGGQGHVRDPQSGQWRTQFTPLVQAAFDARFPSAAARLGYEDA